MKCIDLFGRLTFLEILFREQIIYYCLCFRPCTRFKKYLEQINILFLVQINIVYLPIRNYSFQCYINRICLKSRKCLSYI